MPFPTPLLDDPEKIHSLDASGMSDLLLRFPDQIEDAVEIGKTFRVPHALRGPIEKIIFVGMGGSAIGGEVIRSLTHSKIAPPVWVSRHYCLPSFVDSKSLCIFSSYSGNTEETLSAFREARKRKLKSAVITSGGELAQLSERWSIPLIRIPGGFPPRTALGYSVFPILKLLANLKLYAWKEGEVDETISLLTYLGSRGYAIDVPFRKNYAKKLAGAIWGRFAAIYSGTELLDSAALRFRNQIEENAKALASHHLLPEMNHNEILGWRFPKPIISKSVAVFLRDAKDHLRIQLRAKMTQQLLEKEKILTKEIHSVGKSEMARLFSVIYLGDWVSFYLACLYGVDPTPVLPIEALKRQLAKTRH